MELIEVLYSVEHCVDVSLRYDGLTGGRSGQQWLTVVLCRGLI